MNKRDTLTLKVYGRAKCLAAYRQHQDGDGANTIGAGYAPSEARNYECTIIGDRLIDAGRALKVAAGIIEQPPALDDLTITPYISDIDGALVIQIDTTGEENELGPIMRIHLNEGTIFENSAGISSQD